MACYKFPAMRGRGSKIMDLYGKKIKNKWLVMKNRHKISNIRRDNSTRARCVKVKIIVASYSPICYHINKSIYLFYLIEMNYVS
jgi:hypothetical protein